MEAADKVREKDISLRIETESKYLMWGLVFWGVRGGGWWGWLVLGVWGW